MKNILLTILRTLVGMVIIVAFVAAIVASIFIFKVYALLIVLALPFTVPAHAIGEGLISWIAKKMKRQNNE